MSNRTPIYISAEALDQLAAQYGPDGSAWIDELAKGAIATAEDGPEPIQFVTILVNHQGEIEATAYRRPTTAATL